MADPTYAGRIKSWNPDKGWGHIECEDTRAIYGKDMFLLRSQLGGAIVDKGNEVYFNVRQGDKGPEATNILLVSGGCGAIQPQQGYGGGAGAYGGQMQQSWGGAPTPPPPATIGGMPGQPGVGQYYGTIKSFNPEKGWGHITCDQTYAAYGKDIFILRSALPEGVTVQTGQMVYFNVKMEGKGPSACGVQLCTGGGGAYIQQQQQWGASGYGAQAYGQQGYGMQQYSQATAQPQQGQYFGTIKSFNEEKGWGHISCEATNQLYGKDMFVLRSALRGARVTAGMEVMFSVQQGQKGPEAADVQPMTGENTGMVQQTVQGRDFAGAIKMFDEEKGWGFLECEETRALFGKDIFVHKRAFLGGAVFTNGDQVRFQVETGRDGRPEAKEVVAGDGGSPGFANMQTFAMAEQQLAAGYGAAGGMGGGANRVAPY